MPWANFIYALRDLVRKELGLGVRAGDAGVRVGVRIWYLGCALG